MWGLYWICLTLASPLSSDIQRAVTRRQQMEWDRSVMLSSSSQLPWPWTPSGTQDMGNFWGEHPPSHCPAIFCEGYLHSKGFHGERRWSLHSGWGTQVSGNLDLSGFLQCHFVMVKGEATMSSNTCEWIEALTSSLFLIETTTTKFIAGMITHKTYEPLEAAKIDPSFFLERGRGNNLHWSQLLCSLEKIFPCNDLSREWSAPFVY